jgi:tetratricopeptide (TPR) repeat protein
MIKNTRGVSLGSPVYTSEYNGETVILYPLVYVQRSYASLRRGKFSIGRALLRAGDPAAAESWLRRSLEERQRASPDNPLRIAESQVEWGACLVQLGRYAEAEGLLLEAYRVFRSDGVAPAEATARTSLRRLIALYEGWNKPARAAEYRSLLKEQE